MDDVRLPVPACYADPAFEACLHAACNNKALIAEFDRLHCAHLSDTDALTLKDVERFALFIHDAVYMRLPAESIALLRGGKGVA